MQQDWGQCWPALLIRCNVTHLMDSVFFFLQICLYERRVKAGGRVREKSGKRRSSICCFTHLSGYNGQAEAKSPGVHSSPFFVVQGSRTVTILGCFPRHTSRRWLRGRAVGIQTGAHVTYWYCIQPLWSFGE